MMPSCDHTGFSHFHSSTTSGSACLIKARRRASIPPRQSASSSIFASMRRDADSRDGDSTFGERLFFIGVSASFASWSILTLLDAFTDLFLCQEARFRRADFNGPGSSRRNTCCNNNLGGGESFEHAEESNKVRKIDSGLIREEMGNMATSAILTAGEADEVKKAPVVEGVLPAIHERWSARSFDGREVSEATLKKVFEAARWTASSFNEQPWRFVVGRRGSETYRKIYESLAAANQTWAHRAPVLMVGVAATRQGRSEEHTS